MPEKMSYRFTEDADFELKVVRYLEGSLSADALADFNAQLRSNPAKRAAFVELCVIRAGVVELANEKAQRELNLNLNLIDAAEAGERFEWGSGLGLDHGSDLNETMVNPAVNLPDSAFDGMDEEPEFKPAPFMPAPVSIGQKGRGKWRAAAGILLVLATGLIVWASLRKDKPAKSVVAIGTAGAGDAVQQPVTPSLPLAEGAVKPTPTPIPSLVLPQVNRPADILTLTIDAVWRTEPGQNPLVLLPSSAISPGVHELLHGVIEITLGSGGSVVIQGPARFTIEAESRIKLATGRLSAKMPHNGKQLTIATPDMNAIDLGTEFGVSVTESAGTHLEVFEGQVQAEVDGASRGNSSRVLSVNQAVMVTAGSQQIETAAPTPLAFVRTGEIQLLGQSVSQSNDTPLRRWQGFSSTLRRDPDLVAYYTFDNQTEAPEELINRALATSGRHDGVFGNSTDRSQVPQWATGRWPQKSALEFGRFGPSAVTFQNAGDLIPRSTMTLGVWYRRTESAKAVHFINGMGSAQTAFNLELMGTEGKSGSFLAASTPYLSWTSKDLPSVKSLPADNRWHFLTIAGDAAGSTRFYVDGKRISSSPSGDDPLPAIEKLVLGDAVFGNHDCDGRDLFRGLVDEMMIFKRVLSDEEIMRIYQAGGEY